MELQLSHPPFSFRSVHLFIRILNAKISKHNFTSLTNMNSNMNSASCFYHSTVYIKDNNNAMQIKSQHIFKDTFRIFFKKGHKSHPLQICVLMYSYRVHHCRKRKQVLDFATEIPLSETSVQWGYFSL